MAVDITAFRPSLLNEMTVSMASLGDTARSSADASTSGQLTLTDKVLMSKTTGFELGLALPGNRIVAQEEAQACIYNRDEDLGTFSNDLNYHEAKLNFVKLVGKVEPYAAKVEAFREKIKSSHVTRSCYNTFEKFPEGRASFNKIAYRTNFARWVDDKSRPIGPAAARLEKRHEQQPVDTQRMLENKDGVPRKKEVDRNQRRRNPQSIEPQVDYSFVDWNLGTRSFPTPHCDILLQPDGPAARRQSQRLEESSREAQRQGARRHETTEVPKRGTLADIVMNKRLNWTREYYAANILQQQQVVASALDEHGDSKVRKERHRERRRQRLLASAKAKRERENPHNNEMSSKKKGILHRARKFVRRVQARALSVRNILKSSPMVPSFTLAQSVTNLATSTASQTLHKSKSVLAPTLRRNLFAIVFRTSQRKRNAMMSSCTTKQTILSEEGVQLGDVTSRPVCELEKKNETAEKCARNLQPQLDATLQSSIDIKKSDRSGKSPPDRRRIGPLQLIASRSSIAPNENVKDTQTVVVREQLPTKRNPQRGKGLKESGKESTCRINGDQEKTHLQVSSDNNKVKQHSRWTNMAPNYPKNQSSQVQNVAPGDNDSDFRKATGNETPLPASKNATMAHHSRIRSALSFQPIALTANGLLRQINLKKSLRTVCDKRTKRRQMQRIACDDVDTIPFEERQRLRREALRNRIPSARIAKACRRIRSTISRVSDIRRHVKRVRVSYIHSRIRARTLRTIGGVIEQGKYIAESIVLLYVETSFAMARWSQFLAIRWFQEPKYHYDDLVAAVLEGEAQEIPLMFLDKWAGLHVNNTRTLDGKTMLFLGMQKGLELDYKLKLRLLRDARAGGPNPKDALDALKKRRRRLSHDDRVSRLLKREGPIYEDENIDDLYMRAEAQTRVLETLFRNGADINTQQDPRRHSGTGWGLLHHAATYDNVDRLRWLTDRGAIVDLSSESGEVPLMIAAKSRAANALQHLLEYKASVRGSDINGWTALHYAAAAGADDCAALLLRAGASKNARTIGDLKSPSDLAKENGRTSTYWLIFQYQDPEIPVGEIFQVLQSRRGDVMDTS